MAKTIVINENQAKQLLLLRINEAMGDVSFGKTLYNIADLTKLKNMNTNQYKDVMLEDAFGDWKDAGFPKEGPEYIQYMSKVEGFKDNVLNSIMHSIENKRQRGGVPFHFLILDPGWMRLVIQGSDRLKTLGANEEDGKNTGFRCLYTLILTIYQNPCIWNDYCFNPVFEEYRNTVSSMVKEAIGLNQTYKQLMPLAQLREINAFKADQSNAKPELFYDPDWRMKSTELRSVEDMEGDFD